MASTETPPHAADTEGRTAPRARSETAVAWVLVIVTCGLAFFTFLGHSPLWNIDEGMHAAMSKDMVLSGDWITPRLNGEAFVDKPVLFTWLVAASLKVLGFSELAARLPSAVLATLVVLLTFVLGRSMGTVRTGLVSALVLATSLEFIVLARVVVHDMTLTACTTLSLVAWWRWYRGWGSARVHLVGFYAAIGLGLLAKGPLAVVLVGLVVVPFLALERRLDALFEMRLGWGALVTAAVAAPWYVAMEAANPGYLRTFFIGQNLLNFAGSEPRHPEPIWFYGVAVIGGLFPWSAYLPQAIWNAATKRPDDERTSFRFLLVWAISMLVFFSAASSKLLNYLLPAFPAAALLIGAAWDSFMDTPTPARRRAYVASTAAVAVIFGTAVVWFAATGLARFRHRYDLDLGTIVAPLAVMTAGLVLSAAMLAACRSRSGFHTLSATMVVFILTVLVTVKPHVDPYRSVRGLAAFVDASLPDGAVMVHYGRLLDSMLFYTNRHADVMESPEDLCLGLMDGRVTAVLMNRDDAASITCIPLLTREIAREGRVVVRWNRAAPDPTSTVTPRDRPAHR